MKKLSLSEIQNTGAALGVLALVGCAPLDNNQVAASYAQLLPRPVLAALTPYAGVYNFEKQTPWVKRGSQQSCAAVAGDFHKPGSLTVSSETGIYVNLGHDPYGITHATPGSFYEVSGGIALAMNNIKDGNQQLTIGNDGTAVMEATTDQGTRYTPGGGGGENRNHSVCESIITWRMTALTIAGYAPNAPAGGTASAALNPFPQPH